VNPIQQASASNKTVKERRRSAGQLLSIANNSEEWKKFYGCVENDITTVKQGRSSSLHDLYSSPDKGSSYNKEKEGWREFCGMSPPSIQKSKSEDFVDLNSRQTINMKHLTTKFKKSKSRGPSKKTKISLPSIHERHNTSNVCKSPVLLVNKSRFKQVQVKGKASSALFYASTKENFENRGDFSPTM